MRLELEETINKARALRDELRTHLAVRKSIAADLRRVCSDSRRELLLTMAEGLIGAHKAAKIDNNGLTSDLIEDALRRVGERLAKETSDRRSFSRKRLPPNR